MKNGRVYLIGAGPGDPGLLTLKGKKLLEKADVVVYDRLVGDRILAFASPQAELIYVGKVSGHHALSQEQINELLVEKASHGKVVARLKGGDPFLFGRGGEEALFVREHGLDFEVVPGITSAIAVPAYAGIPVTHRDATSSFAVITGHEKPDKTASSIKWKEIANGIGTLVFLMGVENLGFIVENLINNGRDPNTPVALVRWGTLPEQEVLTGTLENIVNKVKESSFKPPAIIVVGEVVDLRQDLSWIEKKPLWGKRIVVTRSRKQASILADRIVELGGEAIEFPTIEICKEPDLSELYSCFSHIEDYSWMIFTSVNTVDIFFGELKLKGYDIRNLKGIKICAIGPATRERLQSIGLQVDIVPQEYKAEGIIEELEGNIQVGQLVLLPRARGARGILPESIRQMGAQVDEVFLYQAVPAIGISNNTLNSIINGQVDLITFTSSSTVTNFVTMVGEENLKNITTRVKVACIGPITADTARKHGFTVDIMASHYTIDGLLEAILSALN
ncbi:MAG: uroporphyrinogen-III C-methyltransferase [Syntrophomonas sp.]